MPLDLAEHYHAKAVALEVVESLLGAHDALVRLAALSQYPPIVTWRGGRLTVTVGQDLRDADTIASFIDQSLALVDPVSH